MQSRREGGRTLLSSNLSTHVHQSCRPATIRKQRGRDGGFILTLELLLLLTIFGTVIYFGFQLYQQWLVNRIDPVGGPQARIYDNSAGLATPQLVAVAEAYNRYEAPVALYRPYAGGPQGPIAALLGFRANSITTRPYVYFSTANCDGVLGTAYLIDPSANPGPGAEPTYGSIGFGSPEPVSDFYGLQGIAFGVARLNGGTADWLYSMDVTTGPPFSRPLGAGPVCPSAGPFPIQSVFQSEDYPNGQCVPMTCDRYAAIYPYLTPATVKKNLTATFPQGYWVPARLGAAPIPGPPAPSTLKTMPAGGENQKVPGLPGPGHVPTGTEGTP